MDLEDLDETSDLCDSPHIRLELVSEFQLKRETEQKKRKREDDIRLDEHEDVLKIKPPQARSSGYDDDSFKRFRRSDDRIDEKLIKKSHHESERLERLEKERKRLENERHRHLDRIQKERDHEREVARKEKSVRMDDDRRREDRKGRRKSIKNSLNQEQRRSRREHKECRSVKATPVSSSSPHKDEKRRDHKKRERREERMESGEGYSVIMEQRKVDVMNDDIQNSEVVEVGHLSDCIADDKLETSPKYDLYHFARSKFDIDDDDDEVEEETKESEIQNSDEQIPLMSEEQNPSPIQKEAEETFKHFQDHENCNEEDIVDDDDDDDDDDDLVEMKTPVSTNALGEEEEPKLPSYYPAIQGCRSVEEFHCLNRINEGTYGVVYRAVDLKLREVVALKRLKMEKEKDGFPITSLREIKLLMKARHPNIVTIKEVVVGSNMDKIYLVMEYVEHDMKSLMESMKEHFTIGEVKTLMIQLLRGVQHLHDNWIIHRDLKTSNLLLSHSGILKIGDFGLAREYGSPLKPYTPIVVTLWYRSPELLLGTKMYSTSVDIWSVGCIFGEFLLRKPLFSGSTQIEQLNSIFKDLGCPSEKLWPGLKDLPGMKKATFTQYQYNQLRRRFGVQISEKGFQLMNSLLTFCPERRLTADGALNHDYFNETPLPTHPTMFPTWPAKSELCRTRKSPKAPSGGKTKIHGEEDEPHKKSSHGFLLKYPVL